MFQGMIPKDAMQRFCSIALNLLLFGAFLFPSEAGAVEVAVLDFDGYGVDFDDASLVSQGLRDAFLEEGSFFPLESFDITDRLAVGRETNVSQARELVGQARVAMSSGRHARGIALLEQARKLHEEAGSALARRSELADLHYFQGEAYAALGQRSQALGAFELCLWLYPGYPETRARGRSSSQVVALVAEAATRQANAERRMLSPQEAGSVADRLRVGAVVSGYVESSGRMHARMVQGDRVIGELTQTLEDFPPFPGDPIYIQLVASLLAGTSSGGGTAISRSSFGDQSGAGGGFEELPEFDEPAPQQTRPPPPPRTVTKKRRWEIPFFRERTFKTGNTTVRIRQEGVRSTKPVTERWWFWPVTGVAVAGAGTTAAVLVVRNVDFGSNKDGGPGTYTVTVETSN
jgi:hypothetical protein